MSISIETEDTFGDFKRRTYVSIDDDCIEDKSIGVVVVLVQSALEAITRETSSVIETGRIDAEIKRIEEQIHDVREPGPEK